MTVDKIEDRGFSKVVCVRNSLATPKPRLAPSVHSSAASGFTVQDGGLHDTYISCTLGLSLKMTLL